MTRLPLGVAAATGWMVDLLAGEPPTRLHPVAWFGTAMQHVERVTYRDHRAAGAAHLAVGVSLAAAAAAVLRRLTGPGAATAIAVSISIAGRMLGDEAVEVLDALDADDPERARARLPALVGRDAATLGPSEIARAVTESVAENTVDAVTAPLLYGAVLGAPGVLVHRAVNTLDAMVGHRSVRYRRFGWAPARADDILNWLPARLAALGVAVLAPHRAGAVWRAVRDDAPRHPSPNGGVIEAAIAGALGVRLGGTNVYAGRVEHRGTLGEGAPPTTDDARRAIRLTRRLGALTAGAVAAASLVLNRRGRWRRSATPAHSSRRG